MNGNLWKCTTIADEPTSSLNNSQASRNLVVLVANPCDARENYWKIIKHAYIKRQFKFMYACKGYIPK